TVSMYSRNTSTGTLSAKTDYTTGTSPYDVAISADGTSVYVTNYNSDTVSMYSRSLGNSSGTFTSGVINTGEKSAFTTLAYTTTLNGQTLTIDARAGNTATPDGTWTSWQTGIASGGSISGLAGNKYIQYRANLSTTYTPVTPTLDSVTINYTQYALSGNLTSSKYDTESAANVISNMLWSASGTSASGTVKFQVRSSPDGTTWTNWCGPATACDGTDYFTVSTGVSGGIVSSHPLNTGGDDRYLQYKLFLTSGGDSTPTVYGATVQYVVNAPPVITNLTASQGSNGLVTVVYDVADADNNIGNIVDVTLQYCTTNCSTGTEVWADAVTVAGTGSSSVPQYATLNPSDKSSNITLSNGNLTANTSVSYNVVRANMGKSSGKWYWEVTGNSEATRGIGNVSATLYNWLGVDANGWSVYQTGSKYNNGSGTAYMSSFGNSDVLGFYLDMDNGTLGVTKNGVNQGIAFTGLTGTLYPAITITTSGGVTVNFGASAFAYSPPSGFNAGVYTLVPASLGVGTGVALGTARSIAWTPTTDYSSQYKSNTQKIRVKANDRDAANNLGYGTSATFTLDTTLPAVSVSTLDSSTGGTAVGTIALTATDNSTLQYRLCNDSAFPSADAQGNSCAWSTATSSIATTTIAWVPTGAPSNEAVYLQVRDLYGNVTAQTLVAPAMPAGFTYADASNVAGGVYREFLSWSPFVATTSSAFASYKVYHSLNNFATVGTLLTTITDSAQNYYAHTITTATSSLQYYRVVAVNTLGSVSNFTAVLSDIPDGTGDIDNTPPYIPVAGIASPTVGNSSANITFSTYTDSSLAVGELATSTVLYASYVGAVPGSCPGTPRVDTNTYTVNHSIYLTGLAPSTQYYYCVIAKDISGNVSGATTATGGTFTTVSGPLITNVTERELTDISALIFWNTNTSSDSKVYFSTTANGVNGATPTTGAVVTVAGSDGAYQHQVGLTGLTAGQTYYYKVSSTDTATSSVTTTNNNNGQYYSFVTLKDTTPPTITGTSTPVLASNAAVVVWQTDEMATSKVDYGTTSGVYDKGVARDSNLSIYHVATLSSSTANDGSGSGVNTLVPETIYYYRVTSKDAANNSATATGTFTTPATGSVTITTINVVSNASLGADTKDTTPPSISNVTVSDITPFGAVVKFGTDEDTVGFVEYGAATSYGETAGDKTLARSHTLRLRGLTLGTEYHIKATAVDKSGNTGTSADQTFTTKFLTEGLDTANITNIEAFQKEIEAAIESILPSLVPPFVSKPQIKDITESGATITFKTNIKAFPVVVYADDVSYDETKDNPYTSEISATTEKTTDHSLTVTGLKGNTKYHIQARAFSLPKVIGKSADVTFITKASKISGSIVERKKDSFTVVWTTEEPTSSIVEYKNVKSGITERKADDAKKTSHSMKIENLPPGTTYEVNISGMTEQGNIAEAGGSLSVTTSRDVTPPAIAGFKVDNALIPGRTDRIQTIVSWTTDEPANSTAYYEEGTGVAGDTKELANKNAELASYTVTHSIILPSLKPGTIYRLKVTSSDDSGNLGSFGPRTIITPQQTASITDIIFKNFEDSFKFLKKI
ncbi:MAG: fibronectin type III domain-containing protein, partial [Candidatus Yonathbacteria bacterium]|nr:fibronectin type III domain-containing protein [Candidatus Yonathbacteria bacterium]